MLESFFRLSDQAGHLPETQAMSLRILILGSGGREHALAWKLQQSNLVDHIFVCPGNGGTDFAAKTTNLVLPSTEFPDLVHWAVQNDVCCVSSLLAFSDLSVPRLTSLCQVQSSPSSMA